MIALGTSMVALSGPSFAKPMTNPTDGCPFFVEGCHGGSPGSGGGIGGMPSSGAGGHKVLPNGTVVFKGDQIEGKRPCRKCGGN